MILKPCLGWGGANRAVAYNHPFCNNVEKKAFKQHFPCYHYIVCLQGFLLLTRLNFSRVCRSAKLKTPFQ